MDIIVVLALIIGALVCLLPGIMVWSHLVGGKEKVARKHSSVRPIRSVATGHIH